MIDMERGNGNTVLLTVIGVATLLVALVGATFAYFTANATSTSTQSLSITTAAPIALETHDIGSAISLENAIPGAKSSTGQQGFTIKNPATVDGGGNNTISQTYDLSLVVDNDTFVTTCRAGKATRTLSTTDSTPVTYATEGTDVDCTNANVLADFADQLELTIAQTTDGTSTLKLGTVNTEAKVKDATNHTVIYNLTDGASNNGQTYVLVNDQIIAPSETHTYSMTLEFKEIYMNQSDNAATVTTNNGTTTINGKAFTGHLVMNDVKAVSNS